MNKQDVKERIAFVRHWRGQEHTLLRGGFSDECSIQNTGNNPEQWTFAAGRRRYDKSEVYSKPHVKPTISIIVWAYIFIDGRSELVIIERDPEAPRGGYTSRSYIWALEEGLLPEYKPRTFFQQDNAKIHMSKLVKEWFEKHRIWVID